MKTPRPLPVVLALLFTLPSLGLAVPLKLHGLFSSHMVLQRDQPITIWGWADAGDRVTVTFGGESAEATAAGDQGRWEVTFPARAASADPHTLTASTGDETVAFEDLLIGDVWVAHGQSNMAWGLAKTTRSDFERTQADQPLLRHVRLKTNEQATLQDDIDPERIENGGWEVSTPETALGFSAIGYYFGSRVQRGLGIPVGIISNARGGASIESMVPDHKLREHPLTKRYAEYVDQRRADFDPRAKALEKWERQLDRAKRKKLPEAKWPAKPTEAENLVSWDVPGQSPSDASSIYNGMFGVFRGLGIKGVIFHQGFNNALSSNCRPKRYRLMMQQMVEGWRETFDAPELPVAIIGFCAGGNPQHEENFEEMDTGGGPYIREAQRLGLADVGDPDHTAFLPAYDVQIPGLHPHKKAEHGIRAARWALATVYEMPMFWDTAALVSAEPLGDELILTFDQAVRPDDSGSIPRGFALAGADGKYYRAHARFRAKPKQNNWDNARSYENTIIHVWSPLVEEPVAVRYGWAVSPEGNLKVNGHPDRPLHSFRTDDWDWPESEDPAVSAVGRAANKTRKEDAVERGTTRRMEEAKRGVEILERLQTLGRTATE